MLTTIELYIKITQECKKIFQKKLYQYGSSWNVLRFQSLTDIINIKSRRIRQIEETKKNLVGESVQLEFKGIINYCLVGCILLKKKHITEKEVLDLYDIELENIKQLLEKKNHDYGEAWRTMRISSFTDQIIVRIQRIKQMEDNGIEKNKLNIMSNYQDMLLYSLFALILLENN